MNARGIFDRYKEEGAAAFTDRSRRPVRCANHLPPQIEALIARCKKDKCYWGARKIRPAMQQKAALLRDRPVLVED